MVEYPQKFGGRKNGGKMGIDWEAGVLGKTS